MDTRSLAGTAVTGGTRRSSASGALSTTGRLNALADEVNTFYGDLEDETKIRKQAEEKRVSRIERELGKIERVVGTETKRRIEASKALQVSTPHIRCACGLRTKDKRRPRIIASLEPWDQALRQPFFCFAVLLVGDV